MSRGHISRVHGTARAAALSLLLALAIPANARAGDDPTVPALELNPAFERDSRSLLGSVGHHVTGTAVRLTYEFSSQLQFPFRYLRSHPTRFVLGAIGMAALVVTDPYTVDALVPPDRGDLIDPAATLTRWGNTGSALPLVLGFAGIGIVTGSEREKETSFMLFESLVTSGAWTALFKAATGRQRPRDTAGGMSDWEGPDYFNDDLPDGARGFRSFPSGHSTGIWAAATVLANQYPRYKIVPILAYGTAAAMSYSRMVLGAHWLSDVVVGGLVGYGCAKQVIWTHRVTPHRAYEPRIRVGVDVAGDYKGIGLTYTF